MTAPPRADNNDGPLGTALPLSNASLVGLSTAEAAARLQRDGPNFLPQGEPRGWPALILGVLREPMLLLLLGAAAVYLLLGDLQEAILLGVSVFAVIGLSLYQQQKSEHALQALRELASPRARVLRDGVPRVLPARDVVVGDVIEVHEGDRVPADARLLTDAGLQIDESMLTGESVPVPRHAASPDADDRVLRASTLVVRGHGTAEVIATGARTEVGRIGVALRSVHSPKTQMQAEMQRAVVLFALVGLASCLLVIGLYVAAHGDWLQALLAGITLAISNIPEEFPVVMTVFLALGAWRLAQQRALVRRAPAIEALGSITVLCTDKTGTLTENRMAVARLETESECGVPGPQLQGAARTLLVCAARASTPDSQDPMERAIHSAAANLQESLSGRCVLEYPFSNELLVQAHVWSDPQRGPFDVACKGAPEAVVELAHLAPPRRAAVLAQASEMARNGLRVLGVASASWEGEAEGLPQSPRAFAFEWRGLLGLADPLRPGVPAAVAEAQAAGVRVVMLTGDHLETARAIANQAGLRDHAPSMLGSQIDALDPAALQQQIANVDVFARVRPEHKLRLVRSLRQTGAVVAMTGDGVNDAPALMAADVGVAMGARGTDVAREAAAIVLLDDNFVTVVEAVRLGRGIYDNIRRAVRFILAVHVPITGLALLPLLLGAPLVLLPLHVVFLELIVDPACSLVFEREPPPSDLMRRPPRARHEHLLDLTLLSSGLGQGLLMFVAVGAVYLLGYALQLPTPQLGALAFVALVVGNLSLIAVNRAGQSVWHALRRPNAAYWIVTLAAVALLFATTRIAALAAAFRFEPPAWDLWLFAALLPVLILLLLDWTRQALRFGMFLDQDQLRRRQPV